MSPFVRNLLILAAIAAAIVALEAQTALVTASTLLRFAFFIAIAVVAYFFWRDFGRREIQTWDGWRQGVFYGAVALFVVDLGWYLTSHLDGRDVLAFLVVAAVSVYVGWRTWREGKRLV
jgi:hypothetical protein